MIRSTIAVLALVVILSPARAEDKKVNIGDPMPAFSVVGVDDKEYTPDKFKNKDVLVIAIVSNTSPASRAYEDRLIAFSKNYMGEKSRVGVIAINVDQGDGNTLAKMKDRVGTKGYNFVYCLDEKQKIAHELGATATPEFFVFNKERKLVYHGALDDDAQKPKTNWVEAAVIATLNGEKVAVPDTKPHGDPLKLK